MLRKATFTIFLLLTVAACAQPAVVPVQPDGTSPHSALLRRVKDTLSFFPPAERAMLMIHLMNADSERQPAEAGEWTRQIFHLTHELRSIERMDVEANALIAYARLDSASALELMGRMEISSSPGNGYDFREKAASQVFDRFLDDHPGEVERVMQVMRAMGDAGIFPFRAAAGVTRRVARHDPQHAAEIVRDAGRYYERSARTHFFDLEFASFLVESGQSGPAAISKEKLRLLIENAMSLPGDEHGAWGSAFADPERPSTGRSAAESFLASLMPVIHSVDPELEARLEAQHPALSSWKAGKKKHKALQTELRSAAGDDQPADRTAPQAALNEIHSLTPDDTEKAMRIRAGIQDAAWRAAAGAEIAVMMSPIDPARADRLLEAAERQAKRTADPQNKLRITAALGRAYLKLRRRDAFVAAITRMFKLADETFPRFSREAPRCSWASLPGARELVPLTRDAADFAPKVMMEQIDNMQTPLLQTHLLISMLEGMQPTR